jgi:hypothetical protein
VEWWSHGAIDSCDCIFQRRTIQQGPFRADYETEEVRLPVAARARARPVASLKAGRVAASRKSAPVSASFPACQAWNSSASSTSSASAGL